VLIVRREPLHPGAQRSLFPSLDYRYWGFYTDQAGDPRDLDVTMRAHAHVEQHICRLKDSGLTRFPFTSSEDNATWLMVVAMAADLVGLCQLVCLCDAASCASSRTGRRPTSSSAPTSASPFSTERSRRPASRHHLGAARPNAGVWSFLTPTNVSITGVVVSRSRNQRQTRMRTPVNRSRPCPQWRREEAGLMDSQAQ